MGKKTAIAVIGIQGLVAIALLLVIGQNQARIVKLERAQMIGQGECLSDDTVIAKRLADNERMILLVAEKHDKLLQAVMAIYKEIQDAMQFQGKMNNLFRGLFFGRTV